MPDAAELAALVGSRLCHDLVSPLGAIGNGVELIGLTQAPTPELVMIGQAAEAAQARLRLYRLAFGAANASQSVRPADLADALGSMTLSGRIAVANGVETPLPRPRARRLALAALCVESALAWGGTLRLSETGVQAEAERVKLDPALWEALAAGQPPAETLPASVHFALLALSGPVGVATEPALRITV